jgi:hypothetical protein
MLMLALVQRICRILRDEPREAMDTKPCGLVVNLRFSLTITNSEASLHFRCYMAVRCSELSLISVQMTTLDNAGVPFRELEGRGATGCC